MTHGTRGAKTIGSSSFDPDKFFEGHSTDDLVGDLRGWTISSFTLKPNDDYVYRAIAEVTLAQVQRAINSGGSNGLHAWYLDTSGSQIPPPPLADIQSYIQVFASTTSTSKALVALEKNAKKGSIRARVASNLISKRTFPANMVVQKLKKPHLNPYFDLWAWSCKNLEWTGPDEETVNVQQSHHILPVFYHHFGCVCPSFESLEAIRLVAKGREVLDVGSGNGYWTYMLRRMGMNVRAVDNGDSVWRTLWVGDTIKADGATFLKKEKGASNSVLLLVYPQVTTDFTQSMLKAYSGHTICVAGTQNSNGFTAFKDVTIEDFMAREKPSFRKIIQTPLPSFAAKDEALYVFEALVDD